MSGQKASLGYLRNSREMNVTNSQIFLALSISSLFSIVCIILKFLLTKQIFMILSWSWRNHRPEPRNQSEETKKSPAGRSSWCCSLGRYSSGKVMLVGCGWGDRPGTWDREAAPGNQWKSSKSDPRWLDGAGRGNMVPAPVAAEFKDSSDASTFFVPNSWRFWRTLSTFSLAKNTANTMPNTGSNTCCTLSSQEAVKSTRTGGEPVDHPKRWQACVNCWWVMSGRAASFGRALLRKPALLVWPVQSLPDRRDEEAGCTLKNSVGSRWINLPATTSWCLHQQTF